MTPLRISPRAATDLEEIGDFIARDNPVRAATFVGELEQACERVLRNPEAYPSRADVAPGLRMAVHKRYLILFRILADEIRIERIVHGARDLPDILQD